MVTKTLELSLAVTPSRTLPLLLNYRVVSSEVCTPERTWVLRLDLVQRSAPAVNIKNVMYDASLHFTRCWATSQAKVRPFVTGLLTAVSRHRYARDHQSESVSHIKWSSCESVTIERQICAGTKQGKHYKLLTLPSHGNGHQHHSQTPSPGRRSHRKKETRRDVSVISGIPSWSPAPSNDVSQRLHMKNHHHSEFTAHFHRFDFLKL